MDPVTVAVVASLAKLSDTVVKDAYGALKGILQRKFSGEKGVAEAVSDLEKEPASAGRKEVLREKVAAAGADRDEEVLRLAQALAEAVRSTPGGSQILHQTVTGDHNVVVGTGNVSITYGKD